MGIYVIFNYIPFAGIRIKKLKPAQTNQGAKKMSNRLKDLKDQKDINELLKKFIDIQSSRIDLLQKRCKRLEDKENKVEGVPFPEVEAKQ